MGQKKTIEQTAKCRQKKLIETGAKKQPAKATNMDVFTLQQNTNRAKRANQGTLAQALRRNARYDSTIFTTLFMIYEVKVQKTSTPQRFI